MDALGISVSKAMAYHTLKRLGLDTDPADGKPVDLQIVFLNREVLNAPIR
jgi:hypothetical protein